MDDLNPPRAPRGPVVVLDDHSFQGTSKSDERGRMYHSVMRSTLAAFDASPSGLSVAVTDLSHESIRLAPLLLASS